MSIDIIVAIARNGVIGREGGLPWRLSTDLKRFKDLTMGKPIVMGRKTFESLGRLLPGRSHFVVSRDPGYAAEGVQAFTSLQAALDAAARESDDVFVIGGGQIYAAALDRADRLHVTHVDASVEGDTHFPDIDPKVWKTTHEARFPAGERDDYDTSYAVYERSPFMR